MTRSELMLTLYLARSHRPLDVLESINPQIGARRLVHAPLPASVVVRRPVVRGVHGDTAAGAEHRAQVEQSAPEHAGPAERPLETARFGRRAVRARHRDRADLAEAGFLVDRVGRRREVAD